MEIKVVFKNGTMVHWLKSKADARKTLLRYLHDQNTKITVKL